MSRSPGLKGNRGHNHDDRPKRTLEDALAASEASRQRSSLLIALHNHLKQYLPQNGVSPAKKVVVEGEEYRARREVVRRLQGELLAASGAERRRMRTLLAKPSNVEFGATEPLFERR